MTSNSRYLARAGVRQALLQTVCLAVCLFGTSAFALDPTKTISQFVHTAWTDKNGAPSGIVAIAQTTDGYLWLGAVQGLFHFDGVQFVHFEPQAGESLPSGRIIELYATRDGSLWISSGAHVWYRLFKGHLSKVEIPNTYQMVEAPDGTLVAATDKGLWQLKDGTWRDVSKEWNYPGKMAMNLYFDKSGTFWVTTQDSVVFRPSGQSQFVAGERVASPYVYNFAEASNGTVWVSEMPRSAHTLLRTGEQGPATEVLIGPTTVLFDRNGTLWVSTFSDGLLRVTDPSKINGRRVLKSDPEVEQFTEKDGLSGNTTLTVFEDREGNIWAGTLKGLDRFRESPLVPVAIDQPDNPRFFQVTHDGYLLVPGQSTNEVLRIGPFGKPEVIAHGNQGAMCEDETGGLWSINTISLVKYQKGQWVNVPLSGDVELKNPYNLACDAAGGVLVFDNKEGLFRLANGSLTRIFDNPDHNPHMGYPYGDRVGRIWLGQINRVWLYEHGKSQVFQTNDGVPGGLITALQMDHTGNVWVGGEGGLSKFENNRFRSLSKSNGLPVQAVYGISEDEYGCLWLAGDSGVVRVPLVELDRALGDPAYLLRYEFFDVLDGLPGKPVSTFARPIVARTPDGRIWFATSNGIAYVNPQRVLKNNLPPPVQVENLSASSHDYGPWDTVTLPARTTNIEIKYTALSLTIPERVRFRYQLEGVDNNWQEAGTRRLVSYSNLGPGAYRFRVIACNNDGIWNDVGATLNFRILPAWYQTIWFRLLYILLALFVVWMIYRLRLRQVARAMSVRFDERLAERTRIARELHDTLLQTVQGSKLVADNALDQFDDAGQMRSTLEKLSGWLGQATQEGRAALNSLRTSTTETNDLAGDLRKAIDECLLDKSLAVRFLVTGGARAMHPIARDEIFWIGHEAIRNACEHGSASELEVSLNYAQDLTLRVKDNGAGIEAAILTEGKAGHFGLQGMRERAQRIGSKFNLNSSPDSGTEMTVVVPGKVIFQNAGDSLWQRIKSFFGLDRSIDPH